MLTPFFPHGNGKPSEWPAPDNASRMANANVSFLHRINAVNAKKLPENRPQERRCYRRPKLTPNVSLQAGQETPKFSPNFLPTQTLTSIFHPYFFHPFFFFTHTFYKVFTHTFFTHAFYKVSPILFFTHSFFHPYFLQSFHPYSISPIRFSPMVFTKFHPYFFSPILFTKFSPILYFTHTFSPMVSAKFSNILLFHPYLFHPSINHHTFHQIFNAHVFFQPCFSLCLVQSSLENEPPCLVYFHQIIFIPRYVFTTLKA